MVLKSSSKKLVKQTKPPTEEVSCSQSDTLSSPLNVSKENLKELCNKSRSQSPAEILTVMPNLAQQRILKDCKSSKAGNDNEPRTITETSQKIGPATPLLASDKTSNVDCKLSASSSGLQKKTSENLLQSKSELQETLAETNSVKTEITPSASIDIPSHKDLDGQYTTTWSQTSMTTNNNNHRRASDISYMFSSFKTTSTMSSNFLSTNLQGLSERLQSLQSMFDDSDHSSVKEVVGGGTGNLHKLLLNRQQLTAAVADRKPKFKISALNRDVPAGSPPPASNLLYYMTNTSTCRSAPHSKRASPEHEMSSAKEMLLKLFYGSGASDKSVTKST